MTEHDRNTRTLIVAFVIAILALIPLRFIEVGQNVAEFRVLGESEELEVVRLPVVGGPEEGASNFVLEAPYDEIEAGAKK